MRKGFGMPACFWRHMQPGFYQKGLRHLPRDWIYVRSSGGGVKVWHMLRCELLDLEKAANAELVRTFAEISHRTLEKAANAGLANVERLDSRRLPTAADEEQQMGTTRIQKQLGEMRNKAEHQRLEMMEDGLKTKQTKEDAKKSGLEEDQDSMVATGGALSPVVSAISGRLVGGIYEGSANYGQLIRDVYERHNPEMLSRVGSLLQKYEDSKAELYNAVCDKYGDIPQDEGTEPEQARSSMHIRERVSTPPEHPNSSSSAAQ